MTQRIAKTRAIASATASMNLDYFPQTCRPATRVVKIREYPNFQIALSTESAKYRSFSRRRSFRIPVHTAKPTKRTLLQVNDVSVNFEILRLGDSSQLNAETVGALALQFLESRQWGCLLDLAGEAKNSLLLPKNKILSKILAAFVNYGQFELADAWLDVFENCHGANNSNLSAYKVLMRCYLKSKMYDRCISVFERLKMMMFSPDIECFCIAMSSFKNRSQYRNVSEAFQQMTGSGIRPNIVAYSILADSLGKEGKPYEALELMRQMQDQGLEPDEVFYNSIIHAFASANMWNEAQEVFEEARERGDLKDEIVFTTTAQMHIEAGRLDQAFQTVKFMIQARVQVSDCIFCTLVNGFAKRKSAMAAVKVFDRLLFLGCVPGPLTYAAMINYYSQIKLYATAESCLYKMQRLGYKDCIVGYSNLINAYGKIGNVDAALRVFHGMREAGCFPNVWVYNSLINMYGMKKEVDKVERLLAEMRGMGIVPGNITYTCVIGCYCRVCQYEKAVGLFEEFMKEGGKVDRPMAGIMINAFKKSSRFAELCRMLQDLEVSGLKLDHRLRRSALDALQDAGLQPHADWFIRTFVLPGRSWSLRDSLKS